MENKDSMSVFSKTIMEQKYSHIKKNGEKETWEEISKRVVKNVMRAVDADQELCKEIEKIIVQRKFIPGGRYLAAAGRQYHQTQNCILLRAEDSREGWSDLMYKSSLALMTGAGIGVDYSDLRPYGSTIRKTGGFATGPTSLMQMVNEAGRGIMQGGYRRAAIWAGLNWKHADIHKFINLKNWTKEVRDLKSKDFNFPATMDMTNISILLDDDFFEAYHNHKHPLNNMAHAVYWETVKRMLKTAEPGFSVDCGKNTGETLRNAPVSANTYILTNEGYTRVGDIVGEKIIIWTGKQWASTTFKQTKIYTDVIKVKMTGDREIVCDPEHEFILSNNDRVKAKDLQEGDSLLFSLGQDDIKCNENLSLYYSLGYIYGDGTFNRKYPRADVIFCTNESKKCLKRFDHDVFTTINYQDSRGYIRAYTKNNNIFANRNKSIFPEDLYSSSKLAKAYFLAGLFDSDGNYYKEQNRVRLSSIHKEFLVGVRRLLESLGIFSGISNAGISTYGKSQTYSLTVVTEHVNMFKDIIPTERLEIQECCSYRKTKIKVISTEFAGKENVYCCDVGVPEHSFQAEGIIISNCTEVTSADDSDICNLGSINLARIESLEEMQKVVELAVAFLLAGTIYSDVPYPKIDSVRTRNRRLGLGLMGLHEWLLLHGKKYNIDSELEEYLKVYSKSTEIAHKYAKQWSISKPKKTRAIAPTGTIGIIGETTTGIEPIFCVAYKRRYLKNEVWHYQYVIDPTAKRLIDQGVNPDLIEDAYTLSEDVERRIAFQAWVQQYVDHAISSTINLPKWGSELNNEDKLLELGNIFMKYLPKLRGLTVYPDGARSGQPLTPVKLSTAMKAVGEIFEESANVCDITKGGSCGE